MKKKLDQLSKLSASNYNKKDAQDINDAQQMLVDFRGLLSDEQIVKEIGQDVIDDLLSIKPEKSESAPKQAPKSTSKPAKSNTKPKPDQRLEKCKALIAKSLEKQRTLRLKKYKQKEIAGLPSKDRKNKAKIAAINAKTLEDYKPQKSAAEVSLSKTKSGIKYLVDQRALTFKSLGEVNSKTAKETLNKLIEEAAKKLEVQKQRYAQAIHQEIKTKFFNK